MSLTITPDIHQTYLSQQAKEFRKVYSIGNSNSRATRTRQKDLIVEEFKEFLEADGELWRNGNTPTADCLKELADLVYVCYQYAENMGWDLDEALHRVHESNMSKLDKDGKPIYREDGKVLKGPNYQPPNLENLV
jgi:predicted HAD superfamily Cof-like phosphohydrolase